jgi:hypothetical protein
VRLVFDGRVEPPRGWIAEQLGQQQRGGLASFDCGSQHGVDVGEERRIFKGRGCTMAYEFRSYALADAALELRHYLIGRGCHLAGLHVTRILR